MRPMIFVACAAAFALASTAQAQDSADHAAHHPQDPAPAAAQPPAAEHPAGHTPPGAAGPAVAGKPMMGMAGMHGGGHCHMTAEHLASVRAELALTAAQQPLWDAFAGTVAGHRMGGPDSGMGMEMMSKPLPEHLDAMESMMTQHLEALRKTRAALAPLWAALTPEQRAKLDKHACHKPG